MVPAMYEVLGSIPSTAYTSPGKRSLFLPFSIMENSVGGRQHIRLCQKYWQFKFIWRMHLGRKTNFKSPSVYLAKMKGQRFLSNYLPGWGSDFWECSASHRPSEPAHSLQRKRPLMMPGPLPGSALRPDWIETCPYSKPFLSKGATRVEVGTGEANMNFRRKKILRLGVWLSC